MSTRLVSFDSVPYSNSRLTLFRVEGIPQSVIVTSTSRRPVETRYLWRGERICQKRDGNDAVQATYCGEGEQRGNAALYYVRNHLGGVTDVMDAQGNPQGALDYSPYEEETTGEGALPDFRCAGMYALPETGLCLTHYRFYDPGSKRWLNRGHHREKRRGGSQSLSPFPVFNESITSCNILHASDQ
jgi:hypothetical protein